MELYREGLFVAVLSLAVVFIIFEIMSLKSYIINEMGGSEKKPEQKLEISVEEKQEDNLEIIAAITAALSMYTNLSGKQFTIKSIIRTKDSLSWRKA